MRNTALFAAPLVLVSVAACESIDSANVRTDGIYASLYAKADGSGDTRLTAYLKTGGRGSNTFLDLSEGDMLTAFLGADSEEMERESLLGEVWYRAELDGDADNTPLRIDFSRTGHDDAETACRGRSAPASIASLPPKLEIGSPQKDARISRRDAEIEISWSPTAMDPISWELSGPCIRGTSGALMTDTGRVVIEKATLQPVSDARAGETCDVVLRVARVRSGVVDPAYGEGGEFAASQVRELTFLSAP